MNPQDTGLKKPLVGLIALACLGTAAVLWGFDLKPESLLSATWRVGLVMSALWLALPPKGQSIAWEKALPLLVGAIVVIAVGKKAWPIALPLFIVLALAAAFLRPRPKRGRGSSQR